MVHYKDDRTDEQRNTHIWAVVGTDPFLSRIGGRTSYAAWAFPEGQERDVVCAVERRRDMKRVRVVHLPTWRPRGADVHVYVYKAGDGDRWGAL